MKLSDAMRLEPTARQPKRLSEFVSKTLTSSIAPPPKEDIKKQNLIDYITGGEEKIPPENWGARMAYGMAKDALTIPAHGINQILLDYPRHLVNKSEKFYYPEETTSLDAQIAARAAGIYGGAYNPLTALKVISALPYVAKATKIPSVYKTAKAIASLPATAKIAGTGAVLGGAYAADTLGDRARNAALGAAFPIAIKGVGTGISKIAGQTIENAIRAMLRHNITLRKGYEKNVKYKVANGKKVVASDPIKTILNLGLKPTVKNGKTDTTHIIDALNTKIEDISDVYDNLIPDGETISFRDFKELVRKKIALNPKLQSEGRVAAVNKQVDDIFDSYFKTNVADASGAVPSQVLEATKDLSVIYDDIVKRMTQARKVKLTRASVEKPLFNLKEKPIVDAIKKGMTRQDFIHNNLAGELPIRAVNDFRKAMNRYWKDETVYDASRVVGDTARQIIYKKIPQAREFLLKEGELLSARNFSQAFNEKVVKGGRLRGYFMKTIGASVGAKSGPAGAASGYVAGSTIDNLLKKTTFIQNPLARPAGAMIKGAEAVGRAFNKVNALKTGLHIKPVSGGFNVVDLQGRILSKKPYKTIEEAVSEFSNLKEFLNTPIKLMPITLGVGTSLAVGTAVKNADAMESNVKSKPGKKRVIRSNKPRRVIPLKNKNKFKVIDTLGVPG